MFLTVLLCLLLSQTSPQLIFMCLLYKSYWKKKKDWEKEKLLKRRDFSFSHSVFCYFGELSAIFIEFKIDENKW